MSTPHNEGEKGDYAKTVLMPGDPLRAKFIAETFLENPKLINSVRNCLGYTGEYKGKKVSVMASGMGMPSIGIYSYELFTQYDVDNIIRIGSAGSYSADLDVYDVAVAVDAYSESSFANVQRGETSDILKGSEKLNKVLEESAKELGYPVKLCRYHSSDVFYREADSDPKPAWERLRDEKGCKCVEMESFALFNNAIATGKNAAAIVTISDSFVTKKETTSEERQNSFTRMMEIALETAIKL
jgi:purine-nucleoside phosphorylase